MAGKMTGMQRGQVKRFLRQGKTFKEIAERVGISTATVQRIKDTMDLPEKEYKTVKQMDSDLKAKWDYLHQRYGRKTE